MKISTQQSEQILIKLETGDSQGSGEIVRQWLRQKTMESGNNLYYGFDGTHRVIMHLSTLPSK